MKTPIKVIKRTKDPEEIAGRLNVMFSDVANSLFNRSQELDLIKLAMLSQKNVMFIGKPGIAKSQMVNALFGAITGSDEEQIVFFRRQFRQGTQEDEVLGTLMSKEYREKGLWKLNTSGKLPEAHFAYLDEINNATEHLRAAMLGILNERTFDNGENLMKCPMICAVATANTLHKDESDAAFNDRWLFIRSIQGASTMRGREQIGALFLKSLDSNDQITTTESVSLEEIRFLVDYIRQLKLPRQASDLYSKVVDEYLRSFARNSVEAPYFSDRRYCWGLHALKASLFLLKVEGNEDEGSAVSGITDLLNTDGSLEQAAVVEAVVESAIGSRQRAASEMPQAKEEKRLVERLLRMYDAALPTEQKKRLQRRVEESLEILNSSDTATFTVSECIAMREDSKRRLTELHSTLQAETFSVDSLTQP